jgi:hypothetical protein
MTRLRFTLKNGHVVDFHFDDEKDAKDVLVELSDPNHKFFGFVTIKKIKAVRFEDISSMQVEDDE